MAERRNRLDLSFAAAQLGRRGGNARASKLSPERRHEIARNAAISRWNKERKKGEPEISR